MHVKFDENLMKLKNSVVPTYKKNPQKTKLHIKLSKSTTVYVKHTQFPIILA